MKKVVVLPIMLAGCLTGLTGCGGTVASTTPTGPLALSQEEAAAIASADSRVEDEEGGKFIQKARATRARSKK